MAERAFDGICQIVLLPGCSGFLAQNMLLRRPSGTGRTVYTVY